ncbi:uncharacterized protein LOC110609279 isoform X2 [Manihot esculenta]|uniref:uncharacterized protein LOC110609279 isoform X2 n=1 Tax=Manihot esculenta TaxID=3983 RepID=UPI001CC6DABA|nr:uncharacterized protein LOC110609279 isoform X2 [Manihot esculenta]
MSVISNYIACSLRDCAANHSDGKFNSGLVPRVNWRVTNRISMPYQSSTFPLAVGHSSCTATKDGSILVDERLAPGRNMSERSGVLAYDLVQGELVQWSSAMDKSMPDPPTAVLLHGILGSRKNWGTFTRRLAREFPMWQFLLVDLRCHGDSASMKKRGPHTVASTAFDVLKLVAQLRMTPRVLIGHSFGGKVVLSMVEQAAKPLARSVRAWILDATPGKVRAGGDGEDHPAELISFLRKLPKEEGLLKARGCECSSAGGIFYRCCAGNLLKICLEGFMSISSRLKGVCTGGPLKICREFMLPRIRLLRREVELKCMSLKMLAIGYTLITQMGFSGFFLLLSGDLKPEGVESLVALVLDTTAINYSTFSCNLFYRTTNLSSDPPICTIGLEYNFGFLEIFMLEHACARSNPGNKLVNKSELF